MKQNKKKKIEKKEQNEKIMEDKIIGEIRILFEQHKDYYEPKGVSSFWNNKYIKCESNGDKKKKLIIR